MNWTVPSLLIAEIWLTRICGGGTTTVYDSFDRVSAQIDVAGNRTTYLYDVRGRQETVLERDGTRTTTVYDAYNRVSAVADARDRTTYSYDSLGRPNATLDPRAVRAEGERGNSFAVDFEVFELFAGARVPEDQPVVAGAGRDKFAVEAERDGREPPVMATKLLERLGVPLPGARFLRAVQAGKKQHCGSDFPYP